MLILTRRVGEEIVIGNSTVVRVLEVSGGGVKLGIVAPREVPVHRGEVHEEIVQANLEAAQGATVAGLGALVEGRAAVEKAGPEVLP